MVPYGHEIRKIVIKDRTSLAATLLELLAPCRGVLVKGGSGLFVGNESAHYSQQVALLEGWSRLLWGIVPLRSGGFSWDGQEDHMAGLVVGTDPDGPYYWGDVGDYDQRMVEMAAIALALLLTPQYYWDPLTERERENLCTWLGMINLHAMSRNNWLFFRVLVNLAFEQLGRKEFAPELMEEDLLELESMYAGDGWYRDQYPFDNYNPLAMQYYALIYSVFRREKDPERSARFVERSRLFAQQHIHFLTEEGPFVPYGRSLTYRFAVISFYSACAFAGFEVLPWGVLKGIVLRNLRWWFQQPIFDRNGFLTVGYGYPSRAMAELYNAPGSPYWSLKSYLVLALEDDHPFWRAKEEPLPQLAKTVLLRQPGVIMQRIDDGDVVLLNAGQYPKFHMAHIAEKYAKFAYSAHYAFSTSVSYYDFEKCGCDSMLYVSDDDQNWRPRREMEVVSVTERYLRSIWSPFNDVAITTTLVPAGTFHVRIHEIDTKRKLYTKEGGFAIEKYRGWEIPVPIKERYQGEHSLSIVLPWDVSHISDPLLKRKASLVSPAPNLNLAFSTTVVPVLSLAIEAGDSVILIACVGAWRNDDADKPVPSVRYDAKEHIVYINDEEIGLR